MKSIRFVGLGSKDKIAFGQAVNFVRPDFQLHFAVTEENVGMMPLFLSDFADAIGEFERFSEIGKLELLFQMLSVNDLPAAVQLFFHFVQRAAFESRRAAVAGGAFFLCQSGFHKHGIISQNCASKFKGKNQNRICRMQLALAMTVQIVVASLYERRSKMFQ